MRLIYFFRLHYKWSNKCLQSTHSRPKVTWQLPHITRNLAEKTSICFFNALPLHKTYFCLLKTIPPNIPLRQLFFSSDAVSQMLQKLSSLFNLSLLIYSSSFGKEVSSTHTMHVGQWYISRRLLMFNLWYMHLNIPHTWILWPANFQKLFNLFRFLTTPAKVIQLTTISWLVQSKWNEISWIRIEHLTKFIGFIPFSLLAATQNPCRNLSVKY